MTTNISSIEAMQKIAELEQTITTLIETMCEERDSFNIIHGELLKRHLALIAK